VIGGDGRLWMRLTAWEDLRFDIPSGFQQVVMSDGGRRLATAPPEVRHEADFAYAELEPPFASSDPLWVQVWASCMLSRAERQRFASLDTSPSEQLAWLAERTAAKDAVRDLLERRFQLQVQAADVEIGEDAYGRPVVSGWWHRAMPIQPIVASLNVRGRGLALAALAHDADHARLLVELQEELMVRSVEDTRL
jgi:phosphopantetheinyl transferase (holo-ACP synthase)